MLQKSRVNWLNPTWDQREIDAVVEVLKHEEALQVGPHVREMERRVAPLLAKQHGVMVNSGTSALYLAVELMDLPPGSEVITSVLTFSATVAPIVRAGLVPAFVDVEPDTYNIDVERIEEMVTPKTRAILTPNLIGNAPDWARIREIADRHGLLVVEDTADTLGARLRGKPTGHWSDISITSFAQSHIITSGGSGGMVAVNDFELADRALLLRRWGRRCEVQMFGSEEKPDVRFEGRLEDGLLYDSFVIFDEVAWNFEPSELHAAFGLVQLDKLPEFLEVRKRNFQLHTEFFSRYPDHFLPARQADDLDTSWICYPLLIRREAPFDRDRFHHYLAEWGIDARMAWSGNMLRQPAYGRVEHRAAPGGYPNADRVMECTTTLPMGHATTPEEMDYIHAVVEQLIAEGGA